MSDGNFNRALLPTNPYAAGLRAGKAQMRAKACAALDTIADKYLPNTDKETIERIKREFLELLRQA